MKAKGYLASLGTNAIYFALAEGKQPMSPEDRLRDPEANPAPANRSVVAMSFIGANSNPTIEALDPQEGVSNYFLGNDPSKWRTNVPGYSKIYYRDLYDGVDLVIHDDRGQVRYDLVVAPGADPAQIEIAFEGAENLKLSDAGDLAVSSTYGDLTHKAPFSYQGAQEIESSFELRDGHAGFKLGAYDRTRELTIDPVLEFSTYLGGGSWDGGYAIAVNSTDAVYVSGETGSTDFPTASPLQASSAGGSRDAFVAKINSAGSALIYSTYLGGSGLESEVYVALDSAGAAYVAGETGSIDFPLESPIQGASGGVGDAFVAKINPAGSALVYSTYLGGSGDDPVNGIACDSTGAVYVTGSTNSTNFPTTAPFQAANAGGRDAFVAKINPAGSALVYSTYLGGSSVDQAWSIAVDSAGAVYLAGQTPSVNFPTASPIQASKSTGEDAFVSKINPAGSALVYSTYLGGTSSTEGGWAIAIDSAGAAYVAGGTNSINFPTASPIQAGNAGGLDGFVTKINPAGSALVYSTYLGGVADELPYGIAVDSTGAAYAVGDTKSTNFPTVSPIQAAYAGGIHDAFVSKISPDGSALVYSTYLGGVADDQASFIAIDSTDVAYVTGGTSSTNFPTASPMQASNSSGEDAFVTKIVSGEALSGTFTNSSGSRVSVYRTSDGAQVTTGFTSPTGDWSLVVPESINCPTSGYKIYAEAPAGYQPRWYNDKDNYSEADCIDAPSAGLTMTLPPSVSVEGDITDSATGLPVDGAIVYAFRSDGRFSNWVQSGSGGTPGHFKLDLAAGQSYRLLVVHGNMQRWFGDSENFTGAADCVAPCTANLSIAASSPIEGYVKAASTASDLNGVPIYVWNSNTGQFAGWTLTGIGGSGRYSLNLPTGGSYKVLAHPDIAHEDLWSDGAPGYVEASPVVPPATASFSLREAALITGTATSSGGGPMPNGLVAAYTTCGCTTPQVAITGPDGSYAVKVASTGASGWQYRVRFISPSYETSWYSDSTSFGGSTPVSAPSGGINQQTPV